MGVSHAVLIDQSDSHYKDLHNENPHGWQLVKVYHQPNPQPFGYKYDSYVSNNFSLKDQIHEICRERDIVTVSYFCSTHAYTH